MKNVLSQWFC